jgi:enediyne polyketide synthase
MLGTTLGQANGPVARVITGRCGNPPALRVAAPELPFHRFLERTRTYTPGVELIVESEISLASDPYLADHVYHSQHILPGVMGLEAMAQAAIALLETDRLPAFEQLRFDQPVVVPQNGRITIRIAALIREDRSCEVVLRSSETSFQVDHFRVTCRPEVRAMDEVVAIPAERLPLDPARDLYGGLLFHSGRFRRVHSYRRLRGSECLAEIQPASDDPWFWQYAPEGFVLGDPGLRDAAVHSIQATIPDAVLLPVRVERIAPATSPGTVPVFAHATERSRNGDTFVYDLDILDEAGRVGERWIGLAMKRIEAAPVRERWPEHLLACHLERVASSIAPNASASVSIQPSETAAQTAPQLHRHDGKPELLDSSVGISRSYNAGLVFSVRGPAPIACDVEAIVPRCTRDWADLLAPASFALAEFLFSRTKVTLDTAATCVWCALECLKKSGTAPGAPLTLASASSADILFRSGGLAIAVALASTHKVASPMAFAILLRTGASDASV